MQQRRWGQHTYTGEAGLAGERGLGPGVGAPSSGVGCRAGRCRVLGRAGPQTPAACGGQGCCFSPVRSTLTMTAGSVLLLGCNSTEAPRLAMLSEVSLHPSTSWQNRSWLRLSGCAALVPPRGTRYPVGVIQHPDDCPLTEATGLVLLLRRPEAWVATVQSPS